jgi:uncharacterized protein
MQHESNTRVASNTSRLPAPLLRSRAGAGFKPEHLTAILESKAEASFFEVHAENYMGKGGAPHAQLALLAKHYALSIHGVGLSIGAPGVLNSEHLLRLKGVVDRYKPALVSEHLAWSTHDDTYYNDLLPVPYTRDVLNQVCEHIDEVQSVLARQILLENPSTYALFENSEMSEIEFITQIARRTGCALLLDVNNVHVSATNHNYSAVDYLNRFPVHLVKEIHLAGHASEEDGFGNPLLIDAHDRPVDDAVWALYRHLISITGPVPTLIEWDNNVPEWPVLMAQMQSANVILDATAAVPLLGRQHAG